MSLPKINYPIFELTLPSTQKPLKFRPFTVKEEKILLIAQESENINDKLTAMRQVVNNCAINLPMDIGMLPIFDLEYCFLKIRAKSVGNIVELKYQDNDDKKIYTFEVDLDTVEITRDPNHSTTINLSSSLGLVMQYPTVETIIERKDKSDKTEDLIALVKSCIKSIFGPEEVYTLDTVPDQEIVDFIESIPADQFENVANFFETMPVLKHELHYKDSNGTEKTITLLGIDDFFS